MLHSHAQHSHPQPPRQQYAPPPAPMTLTPQPAPGDSFSPPQHRPTRTASGTVFDQSLPYTSQLPLFATAHQHQVDQTPRWLPPSRRTSATDSLPPEFSPHDSPASLYGHGGLERRWHSSGSGGSVVSGGQSFGNESLRGGEGRSDAVDPRLVGHVSFEDAALGTAQVGEGVGVEVPPRVVMSSDPKSVREFEGALASQRRRRAAVQANRGDVQSSGTGGSQELYGTTSEFVGPGSAQSSKVEREQSPRYPGLGRRASQNQHQANGNRVVRRRSRGSASVVRHGSIGSEEWVQERQAQRQSSFAGSTWSEPPSGAEPEVFAPPAGPPPSYVCSSEGLDLNSSTAYGPDFSFVATDLHHTPIIILSVLRPRDTCRLIEQYLREKLYEHRDTANILRLERLELDRLNEKCPAHLVLLQDACHLNASPRYPITILALISKGDSRVRWFWTLLSTSPLLHLLGSHGYISPRNIRETKPGKPKHRRLLVYLREAFAKAVEIPQHPDYVAARQLTDYCPPISRVGGGGGGEGGGRGVYPWVGGETALTRILALLPDPPAASSGSVIAPETDRYLTLLHPAEAALALSLKMPCAAYLLLRTRFFHAFWKELLAGKERIGDGPRKVRTEAAHQSWLMEYAGLRKVAPGGGQGGKGAAARGKGKVKQESKVKKEGVEEGMREGGSEAGAMELGAETTTQISEGEEGDTAAEAMVVGVGAGVGVLKTVRRNLRPKEARRVVVGWRTLGLLEEAKFLVWIEAGGMLGERVDA